MVDFSPGPHASIHQLPSSQKLPSLTKLTINCSIFPEEQCVCLYWACQGPAAPGCSPTPTPQQAAAGFWTPGKASTC